MSAPVPGLNLACKITLARLLGVPVFILCFLYYKFSLEGGEPREGFRTAALLLFTGVAATDALDGYVARTRDQITELGRILDPLADKALLVSALILLTRPSLAGVLDPQFPIAFTVLVLSRDALLLVGSLVIHALGGRVKVRPRLSGKIATALLMVCIVWSLMQIPSEAFGGLVWICGAFVTISGVHYLGDWVRQMNETLHAAHGGRPA